MQILEKPISKKELSEIAPNYFGDMVKAVVDIKERKIAIDAELHSDLESVLLDRGSAQDDLWGINLWLNPADELIEYDSLINIRPRQNNRSRDVEDEATRKIIADIVREWVR